MARVEKHTPLPTDMVFVLFERVKVQARPVIRMVIIVKDALNYIVELFYKLTGYSPKIEAKPIKAEEDSLEQQIANVLKEVIELEKCSLPAWDSDEAFNARTKLKREVREDIAIDDALERAKSILTGVTEKMKPLLWPHKDCMTLHDTESLLDKFEDQPLLALVRRIKYLPNGTQLSLLSKIVGKVGAKALIEAREQADLKIEKNLNKTSVKIEYRRDIRYGRAARAEGDRLVMSLDRLFVIEGPKTNLVADFIEHIMHRLDAMSRNGFDVECDMKQLLTCQAILDRIELPKETRVPLRYLPPLVKVVRKHYLPTEGFTGLSKEVVLAFNRQLQSGKITELRRNALYDLCAHLHAYECLDELGSPYAQSNLVWELFRAFGRVVEATLLEGKTALPMSRSLAELDGSGIEMLKTLDTIHLPARDNSETTRLASMIKNYAGNSTEQMMIRQSCNQILAFLLGEAAPQFDPLPFNFKMPTPLPTVCDRLGSREIDASFEGILEGLSLLRHHLFEVDQVGMNLTVLNELCYDLLRASDKMIGFSYRLRMENLISNIDHAMHRLVAKAVIEIDPPQSMPIEDLVVISTRVVSDKERREILFTDLSKKTPLQIVKHIRSILFQEVYECLEMVQNTLH